MQFIVRPESQVPVSKAIKVMAYGDMLSPRYRHPDIAQGRLYRLERIHPRLRQFNLNNPLFATPQFKAQVLYTLNTKTAQIPSSATTAGKVVYPTLAKL